jgi:DNA-directed RNA polymerase, mitochondrial
MDKNLKSQRSVQMSDLMKRQLELEQEGVDKGIAEYRSRRLTTSEVDLQPGQALLKAGMVPMIEALDLFLAPSDKGRAAGRLHSSKKFFKLLKISSEELSYLTLRFCLTIKVKETLPLQTACINLTDTILAHHEYRKFKAANPGYLRKLEETQSSNMNHRKTVVMLKKRQWGITDTEMSSADKLLVGLQLLELCMKSTGLVMKHNLRGEQGGVKDLSCHIVLTPKALAWLEKHHDQCELLTPTLMPMVKSPKPWTAADCGGYYSGTVTGTSNVMKTQFKDALGLLNSKDLSQVFSALNSIQETPWAINKDILTVLDEVWKSGSTLGGIPSPELRDLPAKPWSNDFEYEELRATNPEAIKQWKHEATAAYDERVVDSSHRVAFTSKVRLAHKFADEKEIFFPHTLDWRGRVYPLPSWINPQADDVGKGLLRFAEGKALGEQGIYWLSVHGANTYGNDKVSFDDRVKWVEDNKAAIIDSAVNPLDGQRFWSDADSPYCFLAFCMEYAQLSSLTDRGSYVSHLPVALDGTCSGLQHFSGMLLDEVGGSSVGLTPQEKPSDIYTKVAQVVSAMVQVDADGGDEMAALWVGKVDRGIAKRPTMTKPYGAKKHGYKFQLMAELKKRGVNYLDSKDTFKPAIYMADRMNEGINQVVVAARDAMDFLKNVAKVVSKQEKPITWTTPVGFPAWQEYRETDSYLVETFWGGVKLKLSLRKHTTKLNKSKMLNSISPNFVHSMDASMLMATVNSCATLGINHFAMIHDSYATHACNTDLIARELREAFVSMYSTNVLAKFLDEVKQQIPEELHELLPELPPLGSLNLEDVRKSPYFFA